MSVYLPVHPVSTDVCPHCVAGCDPTDIAEAARVDMVNEHAEDIRNAYVYMIYNNYVRLDYCTVNLTVSGHRQFRVTFA